MALVGNASETPSTPQKSAVNQIRDKDSSQAYNTPVGQNDARSLESALLKLRNVQVRFFKKPTFPQLTTHIAEAAEY